MSARSAWTRGPPLSHFRLSSRNGGGRPATSQVKTLARLSSCVLLLAMVWNTRVVRAYPRLDEAKGGVINVYFPTHYCNPLPEHELIRRMGPSFDSSRMATSEEGLKRSVTPVAQGEEETDEYGEEEEEEEEDMGDEMEEELEEEEEEAEGASDVDDESAFVDSAMGRKRDRGGGGARGGGGGYGSNRDMADREMADQHDGSSSRDSFTSTTERPVLRYPLMRRRRRSSSPSDHVRTERDLKQSDDSLLPIQILTNSKKKKLRKQLKQKLRGKLKSRKFRKDPPWECKMRTVFEKTKADYFPKYVRTGRCMTDKCFYRLYRCVPKKYRVTLMKRDPDHCVPIPTLGQNTTFEEHWEMVRHYVIVGCDCQPKRRRQKKK